MSPSGADAAQQVIQREEPGLAVKHLAVLFVAALLIRAALGTAILLRAEDRAALTFPDEQQYWAMSRALRQGQPLTDELGFHATRMPLYPTVLSLLPSTAGGVTAARIGHWVLGALVAPLTALLGVRIGGRVVGFAAGGLVAVDPALVGLSSLLLTETAFLVSLIGLWLVAWPLVDRRGTGVWRWIGVGAVAALCVYVRPSTVGLVVLMAGWLVIRQGASRPRSWAGALLMVAVIAGSLVPWAARNHRLTGHWTWLTNRMGISLYDGVGPQATGAGDLGEIKAAPPVLSFIESGDEHAWNEWFRRHSWEAMKADPGRILRLARIKLARTWSPWLHAEEVGAPLVRVAFAGWSVVLYAGAVYGAMVLRRRWPELIALLLPAFYLAILHCIFVGSVRYRAGAIPMLALLAGVGMVRVVERFTGRRTETEA